MEFKTGTGADVVITAAPFEDALVLSNMVAPYLGAINAFTDQTMNIRSEDLMKIMIEAAVSSQIQGQVMKCLKRCTYGGHAITERTFDATNARADYFEVMVACIKENVSPFMNGLFLQFSALLEALQTKRADSPKSA